MAASFVKFAVFLAAAAWMSAANSYVESVETWRRDRETRLRADDGWLTVAGLFWLRDGEQTIGSAPDRDIRLPGHSAPPALGVIRKTGDRMELRYAEPGKRAVELKPDSSGEPTMVNLGDLTFWVIHRGDRYALRLRDKRSELRAEFKGCRWYPVKPEYRVEARLQRYDQPRKMRFPSSAGGPQEMESPGEVEFEWKGRTMRLTPVWSDSRLWFIFRDATSGQATYGGGRFLYADAPENGRVVLDFNHAYNPPCTFTPYATCPLPPPENRLSIAIEAGEMNYGEGH